MKANRKFLKNDEEAVSPVIAVILMVAITVVLAATVYVWVSGFGSSNSAPAKTIALTSAGALGLEKNYTIASATPGLRWQDLTFTLDGVAQVASTTAGDCTTATPLTAPAFAHCSSAAANPEAATSVVDAGDKLRFRASSGQTLRVIDSASNSQIYSLVIQ